MFWFLWISQKSGQHVSLPSQPLPSQDRLYFIKKIRLTSFKNMFTFWQLQINSALKKEEKHILYYSCNYSCTHYDVMVMTLIVMILLAQTLRNPLFECSFVGYVLNACSWVNWLSIVAQIHHSNFDILNVFYWVA